MTINMNKEGYYALAATLEGAYNQAAEGKGNDRHNPHGTSFLNQPIMLITEAVGVGFPLGQALKKIQEANTMLVRGNPDQAIRELQGAIVYVAAAIINVEGDEA